MDGPDRYIGAYERYKAATTTFTDWLTTKAVAVGFHLDGVSQEQNLSKKQLKKQKKAKTGPVKISVQQLVGCASFLVKQSPAITIPCDVVIAAHGAIDTRSRYSQWFRGTYKACRTDYVPPRSNQQHEHFLNSLREMLSILEPFFEQADSEINNSKKYEQSTHKILYELLEIEEIDEPESLPCFDVFVPSRPGERARDAPRPSRIRSNWVFKAFGALQDINDLRARIRLTWERYAEGKIDAASAAFVTDIAFELMEVAEEQTLRPMFDVRTLTPVKVAFELFGIALACSPEPWPRVVGPSPSYHIQEWLGLAILATLEDWLEDDHVVIKVLDDKYPPVQKARSHMNEWERHATTSRALGPVICDTAFEWSLEKMTSLLFPIMIKDKVTEHIHKAKDTGMIESVAFLMQLLVISDINDVLGIKISEPCQMAVNFIEAQVGILNKEIQFLAEPTASRLDYSGDRSKSIKEELDYLRNLAGPLQDDRVGLAHRTYDEGMPPES